MIALRVIMLLGLAALTVAEEEEPDCSTCEYNDNIGYVKSEIYCQVYYVCYRNPHKPDHYKYSLLCCDAPLDFNPANLACDWSYDTECIPPPEYLCPHVAIVDPKDFVCPYYYVEGNEKAFKSLETHQVFHCSFGTAWDQYLCGCKFSAEYHEHNPYCVKILSYDFKDDFNSEACNGNFAAGVPRGDAVIAGETLCLDGHYDSLAIPYLNNYFASNPIGLSFTLCFWFKQQTLTYGQGLFSTNCDYGGVSFIDIYLDNNVINVAVSGNVISTSVGPSEDEFISVCVLFDNGDVSVYVNGNEDGKASGVVPINNQYAASLGIVHGYEDFKGYFDDFCFWTEANAQFAIDHSSDGASNENYSAPDGR